MMPPNTAVLKPELELLELEPLVGSGVGEGIGREDGAEVGDRVVKMEVTEEVSIVALVTFKILSVKLEEVTAVEMAVARS